MPHLVASFLRSSQGNISNIKNAAVSRSRNGSRNPSRNTSRNTSPHNDSSSSSADGDAHTHAVKMPDLVEAVKKHHRLSLHFGRSSFNKEPQRPYSPVTLDWNMESPPVVLHGAPDESTGALVSGQLFVDIKEEFVELDSFSAVLNLQTTHKRPAHKDCNNCQTQTMELRAWSFLAQPAVLYRGRHQFPFSALLDGQLPASVDTPLVSITYELKAEAVIAHSSESPAAAANHHYPAAKFAQAISVKRSLPEPLYPHHSVRVFPPTNIKADAHYMSVIRPSGTSKMTLKLDGLLSRNEKVKTLDLWKLKKLTWKLEETTKTVAPACERHMPTPSSDSEEASPVRGVSRAETRVIGEKHLYEGWKSDYSGTDGTVDMEFDFGVNQHMPHTHLLKYACDVKTPEGTEVSHSLVLELVVSKEYAPENKPHVSHQTGTGRVLRMHFAVTLTDCAGLGVSWDNEAPPVYEDVPPSPPEYPTEPPIEYDDLEELDALRAGNSAPCSRRGSAS